MGQRVALAVVFPRESLARVLAGGDRAFFRPLVQMRQLVCTQVAEALVALDAECFFAFLSSAYYTSVAGVSALSTAATDGAVGRVAIARYLPRS